MLKPHLVPGSFAAVLLLAAVAIAIGFRDYRPEIWLPSLACNLFTTALAIFMINALLADQEKKRRRARRRGRRLLALHRTFYPSLGCLRAGDAIALRALHGSWDDLMAFLAENESEYREDLDLVRRKLAVYGRFLSFRQLQALEGMISAVDGLLHGYKRDNPALSEELQKMGIFGCLEGLERNCREFVSTMPIPDGTRIVDSLQATLRLLDDEWGHERWREKMMDGVTKEISETNPPLARELRQRIRERKRL